MPRDPWTLSGSNLNNRSTYTKSLFAVSLALVKLAHSDANRPIHFSPASSNHPSREDAISLSFSTWTRTQASRSCAAAHSNRSIVHCPFEHSVPTTYVMNKRQLRDSFPQQERAKIAHSIFGTSKACVLDFALLKCVLPLFLCVFRWETIVRLARPGSPARKPSHILRWCG